MGRPLFLDLRIRPLEVTDAGMSCRVAGRAIGGGLLTMTSVD